MPAITSLVVDDRESTPVSHTFVPTLREGNVAIFESGNGTPAGNDKLSFVPKRVGDKHRVAMTLSRPTLVAETINGVVRNKVERMAYAKIEFTFENNSTAQERKNVVGMIHNLTDENQTEVMEYFEDLQRWW